VLRQWALLYREFATEFLTCLYGRVSRDTIEIALSVPADVRPSHSTRNEVTPVGYSRARPMDGCPLSDPIGDAHSHPPSTLGEGPDQFRARSSGRDRCYASATDWRSLADEHATLEVRFTVVVCDVGAAAFFFSDGTAARCRYDPEVRDAKCQWETLPRFVPTRP
jgi:hypothetical protein